MNYECEIWISHRSVAEEPKSSDIWCCVTWWVVPNVLKNYNTWLRRWMLYTPLKHWDGTVSCPRRFESSAMKDVVVYATVCITLLYQSYIKKRHKIVWWKLCHFLKITGTFVIHLSDILAFIHRLENVTRASWQRYFPNALSSSPTNLTFNIILR